MDHKPDLLCTWFCIKAASLPCPPVCWHLLPHPWLHTLVYMAPLVGDNMYMHYAHCWRMWEVAGITQALAWTGVTGTHDMACLYVL